MTPEGYMVCIGVPIARTGEMVYGEGETPLETDEEGQVLIDREEHEVFRPETIASFEGKPITITHPTDFVDPANWSRLCKGVLQNVRRGEGENRNDLIADLLITDQVAIGLVKSGLREVSCGYDAEYTQTDEGRGLQTKIIGNHLALVEQGRAGAAYAINDHKGKGAMKFKEKITAIFARAQDEAMKVAEDAAGEEKKDDKKDDKAKDVSTMATKSAPAEVKATDVGAYDELTKMVKDLGEKIAAMAKPADASTKTTENMPAEVEAKDDEVATSLEDRMKALETAVAKILEGQSMDADEDMESEDADEDDGESEDDDFEESTMTGDAASRIEILAPGLKSTGKDAKAKALKAAYATKDGKAVIDSLTGGKAPELKDEARVNTLFIAASELLKVARQSELSSTKQVRDSNSDVQPKGYKTAEEMNEFNAKHYAVK